MNIRTATRRVVRTMTRGVVLASACAALFAGALSQPAKAELKSITIGSNPAGSAYFLLSSGFAKLFQEKLGIRSTAQPHAGSSVYLPLMEAGEITMGLNNSLDSGMAVEGIEPYTEKMTEVRTIARVWVLPYAYIVKENSGLKSMSDLKGKKVTVKVKTNVSLKRANEAMLATAGLDESNIEALDSGGVVAGINMVVEDRADATTVALAMPAMRKNHASVPGGLRVIPLGPKASDEFLGKLMPGLYTLKVSHSKLFPFVPGKDVTIGAFDTYLNAGSTVGDEDAYQFAKTLHTHWKELQKGYAPLRSTPVDGLAPPNGTMPYHQGAIKYYREAGIWTPAHDKRQKERMAIVEKN